jgi:hypothetical protein
MRPTLLTGNVTAEEFAVTHPEIDSRLSECSFKITPPPQDFRRAS